MNPIMYLTDSNKRNVVTVEIAVNEHDVVTIKSTIDIESYSEKLLSLVGRHFTGVETDYEHFIHRIKFLAEIEEWYMEKFLPLYVPKDDSESVVSELKEMIGNRAMNEIAEEFGLTYMWTNGRENLL
jgi:hypothetical protein